jgi:DNA polymerase
MNTKEKQLNAIREQIMKDNVCPNLAKTAKHLVFGEGPASAKVVFVGEAPGKHEDESGRPFVGAAGRFLNEMLESIGLKRADVYITSILKYRPPKNRDPKSAEKEAFWPYLQAQLEVINPKLVVTLGRHSTNCFLPDLQIGKAHGQPQRYKKWAILPLYHPAAALYNSSMRQTLFSDFGQVRSFI